LRVIEPSVEIIDCPDGAEMLKMIEYCGRVCYKSEDRITDGSAERFIKQVIKSGHESVLEHAKITVKVICDRGITHEIVRHRLASYSQESSRYCCYTGADGKKEMTFIEPLFWKKGTPEYLAWEETMRTAEKYYNFLINECGSKPEEARALLPNSLKTEIVMTMNLREWRHFFRMRLSRRAHPQMRQVAEMIVTEFRSRIPIIFDDITTQET